eukprot:4810657-Pleurochrysis_carterae.AAC.1
MPWRSAVDACACVAAAREACRLPRFCGETPPLRATAVCDGSPSLPPLAMGKRLEARLAKAGAEAVTLMVELAKAVAVAAAWLAAEAEGMRAVGVAEGASAIGVIAA